MIAFSITNNPLQVGELQQLVRDAYDVQVSESWTRAWKKKHDKLFKPRKAKLLTAARDSDRLIVEVEDFCSAVEEVQEHYSFSAATVVNADETRIMIGSEGKVVLEFKGKERPGAHGMKNHIICSMLTFFQANGMVLMSVYCLPSARVKSDEQGTLVKANFCAKTEDRLFRGQWPVSTPSQKRDISTKLLGKMLFIDLLIFGRSKTLVCTASYSWTISVCTFSQILRHGASIRRCSSCSW